MRRAPCSCMRPDARSTRRSWPPCSASSSSKAAERGRDRAPLGSTAGRIAVRHAVAAARRARRTRRGRRHPGGGRARSSRAGARDRRGRRPGRRARAARRARVSRRAALALARARPAARSRPDARARGRARRRRRARRPARRAFAGDGVAHPRLWRACADAGRAGAVARVRRRRQRADDRGVLPRRALRSRAAALAVRGRGGVRHRRVPGALPGRPTAAPQPRSDRRRRLLPHAPEPRQLLALLAQRQHRARRGRRRRVLRLVSPAPRRAVRTAGARTALLATALVIVVTASLAAAGVSPSTPWRHLYLVPVVLAALRFGAAGGLLTALGAALAFGPFVLREIEGHGATRAAAEGVLTLALLALLGALVGSLAACARRQRERYETLRAVQCALAEPAPLERIAARLAGLLTRRLAVDAAGLVLDEGRVVAGAPDLEPRSLAAHVLARREPVFVADAGTDARARRIVVVPLMSGREAIGALAVERLGDVSRGERDALVGLGAAIGLALDNARLAARQRRFAEELAQKVGEATARLAEMDRLKSDFVALASHELRTPLTALQGFSELLATPAFAPDEVRRLGEIMRGEIERLGRIVSDFLDLARLERGLAPAIRRAVVDPAPLIAAAVELFQRTRTTHRLELQVEGALPHVDADADALDRVLKNLIGNALKYSPPGSCVRVRARAADGMVAVDEEDEGPGIPADERARVFEPYYRVRARRRECPAP